MKETCMDVMVREGSEAKGREGKGREGKGSLKA